MLKESRVISSPLMMSKPLYLIVLEDFCNDDFGHFFWRLLIAAFRPFNEYSEQTISHVRHGKETGGVAGEEKADVKAFVR